MTASIISLLTVWGLGLGFGPGPSKDDAAPPASEGPAETAPPAADADDVDDVDQAGPQVLDVVLPCGIRVITATDASLPVAAVVLSIEVGTRDDPEKAPGLVHALAYHLQQGNRELGPGEAIAIVHDVGGLASMAVGPAQVRFESLVPVSQLDSILRAEALRLRAPNTGRELWLKSLSYARTDDSVRLVVPREAAAAAWADPTLAHDGRVVDQALGDMLDQALGAQMARLFDYRNATLVVVGPEDPKALLARVEPLFADLDARPRKPITATVPAASPSGARVVELDRQNGDTMIWAVAGEPEARAWAQVLCGTLNRQLRIDRIEGIEGIEAESAKSRVRCTFSDDPRRPLLVVRAIGYDPATGPEPMIAARLARVANAAAEPELSALIEAQRARIEADLEVALLAPLDLASHLASAAERQTSAGAGSLRARAELLGSPDLKPSSTAAASLAAAIPELLDTRHGVLLVPLGAGGSPAPDPAEPPPSESPEPSEEQP